eukprot:6707331-Prymnesium_polylepis.1
MKDRLFTDDLRSLEPYPACKAFVKKRRSEAGLRAGAPSAAAGGRGRGCARAAWAGRACGRAGNVRVCGAGRRPDLLRGTTRLPERSRAVHPAGEGSDL